MNYAQIKDFVKSGDIEIKTGPFGTQLKANEYTESGTPVLNVRNLGFGNVRTDKLEFVGAETTDRLSMHLLRKGDLVFGRKGAVERHSYITDREKGWMQGSDCIRIRVNTTSINSRFLSYFFLTKAHQAYMMSACSHGTTMASLNQGILEQIVFPLPTRKTQDKIVTMLSCIDDKIELNSRINENLQQQAVAIYKAWFSDCSVETGSTPWPNTTIEEITSLVVRGITPKYNDDTDQIVINQKCIRNHMIDLAPARRHLPKAITEKWLMQGDILINSTGEGTLGRVAQVWFVPNNLTVDSHVTIVRPKSSSLRNYIGFWGLTHEKEIEALHTGSTGQTELPRERVKAMELPLPDESTLSRFNELITPMTQAIIKNQHENLRLGELRDALLPRLMSGELDVSELNL